jgi:drug/metabolite transporter (DMT)-like permease
MALAILLTIVSAIAVNWAYVREHDVAAALPELSLRRPLGSARMLLGDRAWVTAFAIETIGFLAFVAAVALAPLALVTALAAGGIAVLAFLTSRMAGVKLERRELFGVIAAVAGLALLGISLSGGSDQGSKGSWLAILLWIAVSALVVGAALRFGPRLIGGGAAYGLGAGVLFAAGDVTTETVTHGGARFAFLPALFAAYGLGTGVLQLGFQRGGALTTAGTATLLTNALPIVAGSTLYAENIPTGALGVVRALAFGLVVVGGVLLARERMAAKPEAEPTPADAALVS